MRLKGWESYVELLKKMHVPVNKAFDFIHVLSKANTGQQRPFVEEEVGKAYTD